ncbi:MAG: FHA domain-containing protein [Deltaproteobacteria bacterium]|jgi:uncharacterized protein|nr:FHA domain-containing protein [Deltaproteobacteria bacterium]
MIDKQLLDILVCPKCKKPISSIDTGKNLFCKSCNMRYPVRDGIPIMSIEEAMDIHSERDVGETGKDLPRANFKVVDGPDTNMTFQLERGTCRAIGRASVDPNNTAVFSVDIALELDETTKRLVLQYVGAQFRKSKGIVGSSKDTVGSFRRMPDIVFTDSNLSRLHAMLFYDTTGVGVLDLVSKNGTFVNGEEVESKLLEHGDAVELGETTVTFEG